MTPNIRSTGVLVLVIVLAGALQPATAFAQAGLQGDPLAGQAAERAGRDSQFDKNFKSKSALGQLEELTGATVDRSSSQNSNHNTVTRPPPKPKPAQPRYDPNRELRKQIATSAAEILIGALFADNSAQEKANAEAAAARAAAEAAAQAEAYRVQQELIRWARIQRAQSYRAEWDSREGEITGRLGGAFDVGTGTAFFGRPAKPAADTVAAILGQDPGGATPAPSEDSAATDVPDADVSVVDLRGSSMVVQPFRQSAPVAMHGHGSSLIARSGSQPSPWADHWQEIDSPSPPDNPSQEFALYIGDWYGDLVLGVAESAVKATAWGLFKHLPGQDRVKALVEFQEQRTELTEALSESNTELLEAGLYRSTDFVHTLGSANTSGADLIDPYFNSLGQSSRKVVVDMAKLIYDRITGRIGEIDLGETGLSPLERGD